MTKIKKTKTDRGTEKPVVIIGGGIFGILSALETAKKGYRSVILEKESEIITGASLVNQCRVHMGYHYPRDKETAKQSRTAKDSFEEFFNKAIVRDVKNHYLIAKKGSLTTAKEYAKFCRDMDLPYEEAWPKGVDISKEKIALSFRVPEPIFDAYTIREILREKLNLADNVSLKTGAEVIGIKNRGKKGFTVEYKLGNKKEKIECSAVVNATYGNINYINDLAGLPTREYQYELCEVPMAKIPWRKIGWAIMDGPFFGVMPFGFLDKHLLYDVELTILERVIGEFPKFKFSADYYDEPERRAERFKKYQDKWREYVPEVEDFRHVSSMYAIRMVLPKKENTDSRPTIVEELTPGFWQIFSGKITTSVPQATLLGGLVDKFLKNK